MLHLFDKFGSTEMAFASDTFVMACCPPMLTVTSQILGLNIKLLQADCNMCCSGPL